MSPLPKHGPLELLAEIEGVRREAGMGSSGVMAGWCLCLFVQSR